MVIAACSAVAAVDPAVDSKPFFAQFYRTHWEKQQPRESRTQIWRILRQLFEIADSSIASICCLRHLRLSTASCQLFHFLTTVTLATRQWAKSIIIFRRPSPQSRNITPKWKIWFHTSRATVWESGSSCSSIASNGRQDVRHHFSPWPCPSGSHHAPFQNSFLGFHSHYLPLPRRIGCRQKTHGPLRSRQWRFRPILASWTIQDTGLNSC